MLLKSVSVWLCINRSYNCQSPVQAPFPPGGGGGHDISGLLTNFLQLVCTFVHIDRVPRLLLHGSSSRLLHGSKIWNSMPGA